MHELGCNRAVDTAADCPNHSSLWSTDLANARDFLANEFFLTTTPMTVSFAPPHSGILATDHCPVRRATTNVKYKLSNHLSAAWRVGDFWMELNTVPWFVIMGHSCERGIGGTPNDVEAGRNFRELITMRHPDLKKLQGEPVGPRTVMAFLLTSNSSPSPPKSASTPFPLFSAWMCANPYSRCSHSATFPFSCHAISYVSIKN
jgi:hypothetical protein